MPDARVVDELVAALGAKHVLTADEDVIPYGFDGTVVRRQRPFAVVFPGSAQEVADVLQIARRHRRAVVTRGSGTGVSGGSVPLPGAIVLGVQRLNRLPCVHDGLSGRRGLRDAV